jgi:hypothetical protein
MSRVALFPTPEPRCVDRFELAAEEYEASDDFATDAIEWIADAKSLPADLVELATAHYRTSREFETKVQDALDGEVAWS